MNTVICGSREEWLQERRKGLGASDAGSIIGVNPWKSNIALWREKTGLTEPEDISDKPYVKFGHDAEEHIRALFALDHPDITVSYESPYKIIRNKDYPFIFCTPDGELEQYWDLGVLEIKTTEIRNAAQWKEWDGRIPDQYYAQVCHQLLATGWEFVYLRARIKWTTKTGEKRIDVREYRINRGEVQEDLDALLQAEIKFWDCVQSGIEPPEILPEI